MKVVLFLCCMLCAAVSVHAQFRPKVPKGTALKPVSAQRVAEQARLAKWSYKPQVTTDLQLGQAVLQRADRFTDPSFACKVRWGEKLLPNLPAKVSGVLLAKHILETPVPGYTVNFPREFRIFKEESGLSWTGELKKILETYGPDARFAGEFVPSLQQAAALGASRFCRVEESCLAGEPFSRCGTCPARPLTWTGAQQALDNAWFHGMQQQSGFFVIAVDSPLLNGQKEILLLDMSGKRFISLNESLRLAEQESKP